ncbi:MAG TPA: PAS domain S-box protein [Devosiaceae bacterium]|jgi:PAS domain S-box-containing protein|nr:PAS domain S-box protein [Devosiaceae bacterium]
MKQDDRFTATLTEEGHYRLLVEGITDYAIYMLSPEGLVVSWNSGAERLKGYAASEIVGSHFSRFYLDETRAEAARNLQRALRDGRFEDEGWRVRKDGTRFWASVVIDPIWDPEGRHVGFAKITRDLTERKAAEQRLRESEQQFRLLVQGVTDYAIYMLDPEGRIISWNSGASRIKGYTTEEIVGQHFSRFYTDEDREAGEPQKTLATAAGAGRAEMEGWRVRKDGTRFWAHVVVDPIRNDFGDIIGFAKVTRDVTERREAEQALEEAREALLQAQKMEAIGQLTGGVAHDFNNLLMAILGSLELVRKRVPYDPRVTPFLENAIQGAQRGTSLTERMLAFARRQDLSLQPVDVPALVRGMSELMQRSIGPTISIEARFPAALAPAATDPHQLEAALLNLVINARDAMPEGGTVTIAGREERLSEGNASRLPAGSYVCLSVSDSGEGMDEETLSRATEPFFTTKGIGKGTGLGLPMVHGLVEQSGGRLVLSSQRGRGTTVELWLPVFRQPADSGVEDGTPTIAADARSGLTVLAVDDDGLVLLNTVAMLEDLGHRVFEATSGREALEILRREEGIDLVISDQAMPNMTGTDLAAAIREEWPTKPVVIATGYAELPEAHRHLPRLAKPFSLDTLAAAIRRLENEQLVSRQ